MDSASRLIQLLLDTLAAYPEWTDDLDETACSTDSVTCLLCEGGGFVSGYYRRRNPPTHRPDCKRVRALEAAKAMGFEVGKDSGVKLPG